MDADGGAAVATEGSDELEVAAAATLIPLRAQVWTDARAFQALAGDWQALVDRLPSPRSPFQLSHWHRLWWKHFGRGDGGGGAADDLELVTLRDAAGRLVAIAPLMQTHRPGRYAVAARQRQFLGADRNLTELRGLICAPEHEAAAVETLRRLRAPGWHWQQWCGLREGGAADQQLAADGSRRVRSVPMYWLRLPGDWQTLRAGLSRNAREALRHSQNALRRDGHEPRLVVIDQLAEVPAALTRFFALHTARARSALRPVHPDYFAGLRSRAFLTEFMQAMAAENRLRVFELRVGAQVVATRIGFLIGKELYLYYSGYDPAWSRYGVMTRAVAEAIQWAIGEGLSVVNLSTGDDTWKRRWRPESQTFVERIERAPSFGGRLVYGLYKLARLPGGG